MVAPSDTPTADCDTIAVAQDFSVEFLCYYIFKRAPLALFRVELLIQRALAASLDSGWATRALCALASQKINSIRVLMIAMSTFVSFS